MQASYHVTLNHGIFETWTTKPERELDSVKQVHGTEIAHLNSIPCEADGLVIKWNEYKHPLAIKTADCMPIVIEGESGVVHLHAGWRGLATGILKNKEIEDISPTRALIGPCIHSCCFEVTSEFLQNFQGSENFSHREDKIYFDLVAEAKKELKHLFPHLLIEAAPICTACNDQFHSYRKTKTTERNWNLYIKG